MKLARLTGLLSLLALIALAVRLGATSTIEIDSGNLQSRSVGVSDLSGGPGAGYQSVLLFNSTIILRISSSSACKLWVRRTPSGPWLAEGDLFVQILKIGGAVDQRAPVEAGLSDLTLFDSPGPLDNQTYELRYQLNNLTPQTLPGAYSAQVVFTVTDT